MLVKEAADQYSSFSDYSGNQLPDWRFMDAILATMRGKVIINMVDNERKQRLVSQNQEKNYFVYV